MTTTITRKLNCIFTDTTNKRQTLTLNNFKPTVEKETIGSSMSIIAGLKLFEKNGIQKFEKPVEAVIVETKKQVAYTAEKA